jgi:hypothetical protein
MHHEQQLNKIIVRDMARVGKYTMSDRWEDTTTAQVKCYIYNNKNTTTEPAVTPPIIVTPPVVIIPPVVVTPPVVVAHPVAPLPAVTPPTTDPVVTPAVTVTPQIVITLPVILDK